MSNEIVTPTDGDSELAAVRQLAAYLDELIEDKRCTAPGDDLLSDLIRTRAEDGDRLSRDELRGMAFILLVAGHETTVNLITNGVHALLTHPDQLAALRADMTPRRRGGGGAALRGTGRDGDVPLCGGAVGDRWQGHRGG